MNVEAASRAGQDQSESDRPTIERQLEIDLGTLRAIVAGIEALESRWNEVRQVSGAKARGYFIPTEDDQVRQLLLAYRNYRIALKNIIQHCWIYPALPWPDLQRKVFLVGFATGLTLYSKSLKLIQAYEHEPLYRAKINEPDAKFEMPEGFFEDVLHAYSSLAHYRGILVGAWWWLSHRRDIRNLLKSGDADAKWLVDVILKERAVVRNRLSHVLLCRLRYDWRTFITTVLRPLKQTRYRLRSRVADAGAKLRITTHYRPSVKPSMIAKLHELLRPGDVLLVRAEKKLTTAILPGFWAHAALYVGSPEELKSLGIADHPHVARHWDSLSARGRGTGCVIEAISPAVQITSLARALFVDHVLVLRPVLPADQVAAGICEAFGHVGKLYDFEFDFNVSTRVVCTELIYRCYHHRGGIDFPLVKRLGRFTLTGDDVASIILAAVERGESPFRLEALVLGGGEGQASLIGSDQALSTLKRIQGGWRPGQPAEAAHA